MAKLVIVNKDKSDINVKAFKCKIANLCDLVTDYHDVLYHDGLDVLPVNGDKIYKMTNSLPQYELFRNNSAAITSYFANTETIKYIKTNDAGICSIISCN